MAIDSGSSHSLQTPHHVPLLYQATQASSRYFFHWALRHYFTLQLHQTEHLNNITRCIFAPTHFSHLDFWAVLEGLPRPLRKRTFIPAAEDHFYASPLRRLATHIFSYHNFPFDRRHTSPQAYRQLLSVLESGASLLMFPQGSRSRDGKLHPFKPLAAMLALEAQCPIVPVIVRGTFEAFPPGRYWPRRNPISVHYGEPVFPMTNHAQIRAAQHRVAKELNGLLMQRIHSLWEATSPTTATPRKLRP